MESRFKTSHASETMIASHQLVVAPGFPGDSGRSGAAASSASAVPRNRPWALVATSGLTKTRELTAARRAAGHH